MVDLVGENLYSRAKEQGVFGVFVLSFYFGLLLSEVFFSFGLDNNGGGNPPLWISSGVG